MDEDLIGILSSSNTNLITDKSLYCPLKSIFFSWMITFAYSFANHTSPKANALGFVNLLDDENLFAEGKNNSRKIGDDDHVITGKHVRGSQRRPKRNSDGEQAESAATTAITLDRSVYKTAAKALTRAPAGDLHVAAAILRSGVTSAAASERRKTFTKDYLTKSFAIDFHKVYNEGR